MQLVLRDLAGGLLCFLAIRLIFFSFILVPLPAEGESVLLLLGRDAAALGVLNFISGDCAADGDEVGEST